MVSFFQEGEALSRLGRNDQKPKQQVRVLQQERYIKSRKYEEILAIIF